MKKSLSELRALSGPLSAIHTLHTSLRDHGWAFERREPKDRYPHELVLVDTSERSFVNRGVVVLIDVATEAALVYLAGPMRQARAAVPAPLTEPTLVFRPRGEGGVAWAIEVDKALSNLAKTSAGRGAYRQARSTP